MSATVGFTDDGKVFMTSLANVPEHSQPAQVTFMWEPKEAMNIADMLMYAARQVDKPLIVQPYRGG
jgi:hypothetical protein